MYNIYILELLLPLIYYPIGYVTYLILNIMNNTNILEDKIYFNINYLFIGIESILILFIISIFMIIMSIYSYFKNIKKEDRNIF